MLIEHAPAAARAAQAGARGTTSALQRLPDSTLRWLAAGSIGLAAGLQLAGVPRLLRAAGVAPALFMGAAVALRPTEPVTAAATLSGVTASPPAGLPAHG
jgi:hypothetical protein